MSRLNRMTKACGVFLLWATAAVALPAQTFKTLANFDGTDGENPYNVSLVQGLDGNFYGTTFAGGENEFQGNDGGTVFKITPDGMLTTVYSFCAQANCADGEGSFAGLVLGTDGNLYGTTRDGGASVGCTTTPFNCGTVFKVTPEGVLTTLHSFTGNGDGSGPLYALIQGTDGDFYGTTIYGGDHTGTIFRISPGGRFKTLHVFDEEKSGAADGALMQASDGNFYGTTSGSSLGSVYRLTPAGTFTTLYTFDVTGGGQSPVGGVVQGTDGNLYGMTFYGGGSTGCDGGCGTVFELTLQGVLTSLLSFDATDGAYPIGPLIQATDGNFYGMTITGGTGSCNFNGFTGCGTIFQITPTGILTTLNYFTQTEGGVTNLGGLLQATNGEFYGTTADGGTYQYGTVFSLNVGLGQFVETNPTSGKVGAHVKILGSFLTGATSVTFNGAAATFTIVSKSEILTTVPTGATTGPVQVISPRLGTLSSNVPFTVN
jgi:uncharacterized repeat protein (TIGR03803 family)